MTTKILTQAESRAVAQKFKDKSVNAEPLVFSKADDATSPFVLEVTNGQSPEGKTLVIHIFKRQDVVKDRAIAVVQHALVDVFGADAGAEADCDYRDVVALKKAYGSQMVVNEPMDSLTIIFRTGPVAYTRSRDWVRDRLATALNFRYQQSQKW